MLVFLVAPSLFFLAPSAQTPQAAADGRSAAGGLGGRQMAAGGRRHRHAAHPGAWGTGKKGEKKKETTQKRGKEKGQQRNEATPICVFKKGRTKAETRHPTELLFVVVFVCFSMRGCLHVWWLEQLLFFVVLVLFFFQTTPG